MRTAGAAVVLGALLTAGCGWVSSDRPDEDPTSGPVTAPSSATVTAPSSATATGTATGTGAGTPGSPGSSGPSGGSTTPAAPITPKGATNPPSVAPTVKPTRAARRSIDLGRVEDGSPQRRTVTGAADLRLRHPGRTALVVQLDCRDCTGGVIVTQPERMSPLGATNAPFRASYLVLPDDDEGTANETIQVTAAGRWMVKVLSWNDLPDTTGTVRGTGAKVLYLSNRARALHINCRPRTTEECFVRVFSDDGEPVIVGDDKRLDDTEEAQQPAVVAISTNGSWSLRPIL